VQVPGHEFPQVPQLFGSLERLKQLPPQSVVPGAHAQAPLVQTSFVGHAVPQAPQFCASLSRSTHALVFPSVQRTGFASGQAQTPSLQAASCIGQALPHPPQSVGAEAVSTQAGEPPHRVTVLGVVLHSQTPFEHTPSPHAWPHSPQLSGSLERSTHPPLQATCPAGQEQVPSVQLAP